MFKNMTFPRAVILLSLIASCVLGYYVNKQTKRLAEIKTELVKVPELVQSIQRLGIEVDQYQQLKQGSASTAGGSRTDFSDYIRRIAADPDLVRIGSVTIDPSKRTPSKDVVDRLYKIRPAQKEAIDRGRIGNFLYKLEADSRRVKVTNIKMTPEGRNIKPGQIGDDKWTFEASITVRSQESSG